MSNNVIPMQVTAPLRPTDMNANQLELIKRTIARDCSPEEFDLFIEVARRVGLDPFRRQLYCNIYNKNKSNRSMVLVTGIDGFRAVAARNGNHRADENEPEYTYSADLKSDENPLGLEKAVVIVWKQDNKGDWHKIRAAAYWDEFAPIEEGFDLVDSGQTWPDGNKKMDKVPNGKRTLDPKNANSFWRKMGRHMLAKCAEAQALRKGWPEDLSGVYAPEEMAQADLIELTATEVMEEAAQQQRLIQTKTAGTILFSWNPENPGDAFPPLEAVPMGQLADRCFKFFERSESATEIETWGERNTVALNEFWARSKADALGVKQAMEQRVAFLSRPVEGNSDA